MKVRKAKQSEMNSIYMMGFDAWADGNSKEVYLNQCKDTPKYKQGNWYVLENNETILSSLIIYEKGFNLFDGSAGMGSIATNPTQRKKGYAAQLINLVCDIYKQKSYRGMYLFSDINPEYYQKLGFDFITIKQPYKSTSCMVKALKNIEELKSHAPTYF